MTDIERLLRLLSGGEVKHTVGYTSGMGSFFRSYYNYNQEVHKVIFSTKQFPDGTIGYLGKDMRGLTNISYTLSTHILVAKRILEHLNIPIREELC